MKKLFFTLFAFAVLAVGAKAQEVNEWTAETAENTIAADANITAVDSIATDTIVADSDPSPILYDSIVARHKAIRRATANCPIDSVLTYDVNGVLTAVSIYEYGDTIRTIEWTIKEDGSRVGNSKKEFANDGLTFYGATFDWDENTNNWKGVSRADTICNDAHQYTECVIYDWVNNDWMPKTKYTYKYDATYTTKITEYLTYQRNSSNQLVLSEGTYTTWYNASKKTLEIKYTAHNGTNWSAGWKKEYAYDTKVNQIVYTYYNSYNGTEWHKYTHEEWKYDTIDNVKKQTFYLKEEWKDNVWAVSSKKIWEFNAKATQTLYEEYSYSATKKETLLATRNISKQDELNRDTLVENYVYTNGVMTVNKSKKEKYTYWNSTTKKTNTIAYKWENETWVYNTKKVTGYDAAGNTSETCSYKWTDGAWVGYPYTNRTLTTYNSAKKPTEVITQTWPTNAVDWVNSTRTATTYIDGTNPTEVITQTWSTADEAWLNQTRKTTDYSDAKTTEEAEYIWSTDVNDWVGTKRSDWHYNAAGLNDTIKTYTNNGTDWVYSDRTVKTYNAAGTEIMAQITNWNGEKWVHVSATRTEDVDRINDKGIREVLHAEWQCGSDSIWNGVQKDSTSYSATGKQLYKIIYDSWSNKTWVPSYRIENQYDADDHQILTQRFDYRSDTKIWVGNYRYEYGFDEQGRQCMIAKYISWNTSTNKWIGSTKTENTFDQAGRVIVSVVSFWGANSWGPAFRYLYTYDGSGRETENIVEIYENGQWVNSERYLKEYKGSLQIKNNYYIWMNSQWTFMSRSELYYDEDEQAKLRREVSGSWDNSGAVTSFTDNLYYYACDPKACIITFRNYDGTSLQSGEVASGTIPKYTGDTPTKPSTPEYTYSFKGWSPELVAATGEATYTAQYDSVVNTYVIAFENYDGTSLQSGEVAYGTQPAYTGDTPAKPSNAQYTYSFKGWDAELVAVTAAATYTAQFDSVVNTYVIAFENYDGTSLQSGEVAYGTTPKYTGDTPTKPSTPEYTYSFKGWDSELVEVTAAATYTAQFDSVVNTYVIAFENYDGTSLQSGEVAYGTQPTYTGDTPNKLSTPEYTYTFTGWSPKVVAVTEAATYTAQYDSTKNSYLITWLYDDGSEISHATLEYGATPTPADATKPATAQYSFVFKGWNTEVVPVTGEATYTAVYDSIVNQYTVVFYFEDGVTEIERVVLAYGETPSTSYVPSIPGDKQYTYVFVGWSPEIAPVTGDASYTAVFKAVPRQYTIVFKNYNGAELLRTQVDYGTIPVYTGGTPAKKADTRYTYQFNGWTPELTEVTGDATYTAVFKSVPRQYTIVFRNYDGTELQTSLVDYGTMPVYTGETPVKEEDEQYTYSFSGWTPALKQVSGNATYTAKYTSKPKSHEGLNDVEAASQATKVMIDGRIYILRAGHLYTLSGSLVE